MGQRKLFIKYRIFIFLVLMTTGLSIISGCRSIPKRAGFNRVQEEVGRRTGLSVHWNQGTPEDIAVAETVKSMLRKKLTVNAAVQIAMLNNPRLHATFEELGIAQADLVQAGLLENPVFSASIRFPDEEGKNNTEFSVTHNFLDFFILPLRKKLAAEQIKKVEFVVGDAVLNLAAELKSAYYMLQGARQMLAMQQKVLQAAEAAVELARRQHEAGNIREVDLAGHQLALYEAKLELSQSEAGMMADRERLNSLMGLSRAEADWKIVDVLPEIPLTDPSLKELEALAISQRLDLAAARQEIQILERAISLARLRVVPALEIGVETEREPNGSRVTGPTFDFEVPIFDQRQAPIARTKAELRQSRLRLNAMEQEFRSEVRLVHGRLHTTRTAVEYYKNNIILLHEQIVALSQKNYNFMLIGVYTLLQAKKDEINARREYIEVLRDYWIAHSELERSVGGKISVATKRPMSPDGPSDAVLKTSNYNHKH